MGCPAYKDLLSRYIDNELSKREREELQAHLQVCSRCSHALAKYRQMEALLGSKASKQVAKPSPAVRDKVLAAIEEQQRQRTSPLHRVMHGHGTPRFSLGRAVGLVVIVGALSVTGLLLAMNPAASGLFGNVASTQGEPSPTPDLALTSVARANATAVAEAALPPAHITSVGPVNTENQPLKSSGVPLDASIAVRFDAAMERTSVEQAWQISPPIPGSFNWVADNEVRFIPYNLGYIPAVTYTLSLSSSAHVLDGGTLAAPFTYTWATVTSPTLLDHDPATDSSVALTESVNLKFSQPMQHDTVQAAFSVAPTVTGKWAWSDDAMSATFRPDAGWLPNTHYRITLGHSAASAANVPLGMDASWQFVSADVARVNFLTAQPGPALPIISFAADLGRYDVPFSLTQPVRTIDQLDFQLYSVTDGNILASQPKLRSLASSQVDVQGAASYSGTVSFGLPAGVYLLVAQTGQRVYLLVGAEQLVAKQAGGQLLLWAARGGKPVAGQELQIYDAAQQLLDDGHSGKDGVYLTNLSDGATPAFILARDGNQTRAVAFIAGQAASSSNVHIYTYTDRAAYSAGDALNFKVVVRSGEAASYALPSGDTSINMTLADERGTVLASVMLRPDNYGMIGGSFPLAAALREGWYTLGAATMGAEQKLRVYVHGLASATTSTRISQTLGVTATASLFNVTLDRDTYSVGDTATVSINNAPATNTLALLTVERNGFVLYRSVVISGSATVALPVSAAMVPAVRVQISLLTAAGPVSSGTDLSVPLTHTMTIKVEPDSDARPGRNAIFTVRVAGAGGQPLPAALSLSVSDAAPASDLSAAFYPTMITPAALYSAAPLPAHPGNEAAAPPATNLAYWGGNLLVEASGVDTYSVALPATARGEWWATARVVGADGSFGQASVNFTLTAPLEVRPLVPASVVQGDRVNIGALLINHTSVPVSGRITLSSDGLTLMGSNPAEQTVDLEPGREQMVTWREQVRRANSVSMVFDFFADDASNKAVSVPLDTSVDASTIVRPATPQQISASGGMTSASASVTTTLPTEPATDLSNMEIEIDPSVASALVGSLGAELDASATGSEAMSALVAEAAQLDAAFSQLQYSKSALPSFNEATVGAMQGVYTNQQADGGWSSDGLSSDVWTTAFTLHNLARSRDAGQDVDSQVTNRALIWLREQLPQMDVAQRAYSYYVLALYDATDLSEVRPMLAAPLDPFGQAALILALERLGDKAAATLLARQLSAEATVDSSNEQASWQSDAVGDDVATALAVQALLQTVPTDPQIGKGVRELLSARVGRRWGTARASIAAFSALMDYTIDSNDGRNIASPQRVSDDVPQPVPSSRQTVGSYGYRLYLNDALITEVDVDPGNPTAARRLIDLSTDKLQSQNVVKLVSIGGSPIYYAITTRYRHSINASFTASDDDASRFNLQNPRALLSAGSGGMSISRSYENLTRPGASDIYSGDTIRITLKLEVSSDATNLRTVVVNDQLPAGFVADGPEQSSPAPSAMGNHNQPDGGQLDDSGATTSPYASFKADASGVSFILDKLLPSATYNFSYLAQATVSGDFSALPATAYPMYQPDNSASSASNLISVLSNK